MRLFTNSVGSTLEKALKARSVLLVAWLDDQDEFRSFCGMMQACVDLSLNKRKDNQFQNSFQSTLQHSRGAKLIRNLPEAIHPKSGIELFGVIPADPAGGYCYRNPI